MDVFDRQRMRDDKHLGTVEFDISKILQAQEQLESGEQGAFARPQRRERGSDAMREQCWRGVRP